MPSDPWDALDAANEDANLSASALCFYFEKPERAFSRQGARLLTSAHSVHFDSHRPFSEEKGRPSSLL